MLSILKRTASLWVVLNPNAIMSCLESGLCCRGKLYVMRPPFGPNLYAMESEKEIQILEKVISHRESYDLLTTISNGDFFTIVQKFWFKEVLKILKKCFSSVLHGTCSNLQKHNSVLPASRQLTVLPNLFISFRNTCLLMSY